MVQIMTKACHEGTCEHAPYPHKIVQANSYVIAYSIQTHRPVAVDVPGPEFVICLACGHAPASNQDSCRCRYDCHGSWEYPVAV